MTIIEVLGYAVDGAVYCTDCHKKMKLSKEEGTPIFNTDDCGPEGVFCECGETIKPPYKQ